LPRADRRLQAAALDVIKQLVELSEAKGAAERGGAELVRSGREMIAVHRPYLEEGRELARLRAELEPLQGASGCLATGRSLRIEPNRPKGRCGPPRQNVPAP
jgi:hypothetical protein